MNEIMNVIHFERKGKMLDILEKFYITNIPVLNPC